MALAVGRQRRFRLLSLTGSRDLSNVAPPAHLAFDRFSEVGVVDRDAELNVPALGTPGDVDAGHHQESVVDTEEFRTVAHVRALECARTRDDARPQVRSDLHRIGAG